ncbi:MAG: D-aminoacyl-tRNA deacylase [Magnetococcus sp. YQC-5]
MKTVMQKVTEASVTVDGELVGKIGSGLLIFLAVERGDGERELAQMVRKVVGLRLFPDERGRMNHSILDVKGSVLAISQFTLAAHLNKGFRPSFDRAEAPEPAKRLFDQFCLRLEEQGIGVAQGRFGANMRVQLINDGPVTFFLDVAPES